jgi:hypothetical protein
LTNLFLGASKPYRMGANVLAQGYGPIANEIAGRGANQPGRLESYIRGGISPEEQRLLESNPYKEMFKSAAGMGAGLLPFAGGWGVTSAGAGALKGATTGGLGGYGYSREGEELQDTALGMGIGGAVGGIGGYLAGRNTRPDLSGLRGQRGDSFQVKIEQGGDKALNAEAEMITQSLNKLPPAQRAEALPQVLQRLDEIIGTMTNQGQIDQIVTLKKWLALAPLFGILNNPEN